MLPKELSNIVEIRMSVIRGKTKINNNNQEKQYKFNNISFMQKNKKKLHSQNR